MTKKADIDTKRDYVELYVSKNCWVGKQLPNLKADRRVWGILPATDYGLVVVIDGKYPALLTEPLWCAIVYRPAILELSFRETVKVAHVSLRLDDMQGWVLGDKKWLRVGDPNAITRRNTSQRAIRQG